MLNLNKHKKQYDQAYYQSQGLRFESGDHNNFAVYFRKFKLQEPLLDLGCSTGIFLEEARRWGLRDIKGLEISRYAIVQTRKKGLKAHLYDGKNIPFKDKSFKTIFCFEVIEHIPRKDANYLIKECYRVLAPGGRLLIFAPAEKAKIFDIDPTHINYYQIKDFLRLIKRIGFKVDRFDSTMLLPKPLRSVPIFSYVLAKVLYKIFKRNGTTIELIARKS